MAGLTPTVALRRRREREKFPKIRFVPVLHPILLKVQNSNALLGAEKIPPS